MIIQAVTYWCRSAMRNGVLYCGTISIRTLPGQSQARASQPVAGVGKKNLVDPWLDEELTPHFWGYRGQAITGEAKRQAR